MPIGLIAALPLLALAVWLTLRQMKNEENSWSETTWRCKLPGGSSIERGAIRIGWAKCLKTCTSLQWKTGCYTQRMKNAEKLRKNACQNHLNMVLYVSAKRWDKRMTSEVSARSLWKEPIDVQKHQLVLRCWERSKFGKVQKLRKKTWQKTTSVVKWIGRQPKGWGAQDLENWTISKELVTEPIFVLEKHGNQFQTKWFTQDASDCVLSETRFNTFKW